MKSDSVSVTAGILAIVVYLALIVAICWGWIANIVTLYHSNFNDLTGQLVLRIVGIFVAPLGAIMGFL